MQKNRILYSVLLLLFCNILFCTQNESPIYSYVGKEGIINLTLESIGSDDSSKMLVGSVRKKSLPIKHQKRSFILNKMENYYDPFIHKYSLLYKVSPNIIKAIIRCESHFKRTARSSQGATGLMQLMPATGKKYGATDLYNADQNIKAGTRFFSELLRMYQGDLKLSLAAYNAGPGNVSKYKGVPPFKETRKYLKKVEFYIDYYSKKPLKLNKNQADDIELFENAMDSLENDDKIRAISLFRQATKKFKPADVAYYNIGCLYDEMGYVVHAEDNYLSAIKENPYLFDAYNNLAIIYEDQLRYRDALNILKKFKPYALSQDKKIVEKVIFELEQIMGDN